MIATSTFDPASLNVHGLTPSELGTARELFSVWSDKRRRNLLRSAYYGGTAALKNLGIALPPEMRNTETILGWPAKAVKALAHRNMFDGFVARGQPDDPFGLEQILFENRFDEEIPQAIRSCYKHSCSFITVSRGDVASGEPEVVVMARSAEWSAALWDKRRRAVSAALTITDHDKMAGPTAFDMWLPDQVVSATRRGGVWSVTRRPHRFGRPSVEPLTYDPELDRPFGRSRISRAVMNITDRAARTALRAEIHAEFFSGPQRYVLGADPDAWDAMDQWAATMGRWLGLTKDEEGDVPTVGQFLQSSPEPHIAMQRALAAEFSGETSLPISALGIVQDNPASAEAIYAAKEDLIIEALEANRGFGSALRRVGGLIVMARDGRMPDDIRHLTVRWRNPALPSPVSASDALVKQQAVFPWIGDTDVALEMAGYTPSDIERMKSDRRRSQGRSALEAALEVADSGILDEVDDDLAA